MQKWIIMQTFKRMLGSRKFVYGLIACLVKGLGDMLNIDPATQTEIIKVVMALIIGQGIADTKK